MKRGILFTKEPRAGRKVFAAIGFSDFAFGVSVIFVEYCPATVSDSETVFLCPLSWVAAPAPPIGALAVRRGDKTSFIRFN
jgi:hypothetical protein